MPSSVDVVLVKPGGRLSLLGSLAPSLSGFAPPLDIGLLAAVLRERGAVVRVIDADAEELTPAETAERIAACAPRLAGVFAHTIRMTHAGQTLRELRARAPQVKTLLAGRHPSALPERTLREEQAADFVCRGEAYEPVWRLLGELRAGRESGPWDVPGLWWREEGALRSRAPAPLLRDLDSLPMMAWDLLPMDRYRAHNWHCLGELDARQPYAIVYTSLGCPYRCSYCCVNAVYGGPGIRHRSPEKVAAEIDLLASRYGVRNLRIADDLFTSDSRAVLRLCDLLIAQGRDLNIWCYARVDTVTGEMLDKMRRAGIRWVSYGLEAGHEAVRAGVFKRLSPERIRTGLSLTRQSGISIIANFVFGLPDDDLASMRQTLALAQEHNFEWVNFYSAMAWPGSALYEDAVRRGLELPGAWSGYGQLSADALPLPTRHLSAAAVLRFRDEAFRTYFSAPRYQDMIRRRFGEPAVRHIQGMLGHAVARRLTQGRTP